MNLSQEIRFALRPIVLHQGTPKPHRSGFLRKDQFTGFSWDHRTVQEKIDNLPELHAARGRQVYTWLLRYSPVYAGFVAQHNDVLNSGRRNLRLPPTFIHTQYLEGDVWPWLYWQKELCESHDRGNKKDSTKAAFVRKLLSEVSAYNLDYSLLQFQFDRYVFKATQQKGGYARKHNVATNFAMDTKHWSQAYWRNHHLVVLDVVRQWGMPHLFLTVSPYEWSFPLPYWLSKVHAALGVGPTKLAGMETLAIAHALQQLVKSFLCGHAGKKQWSTHYFGDKSAGKDNPVRGYFGRYEYQDGGKSHQYGKGRGSLHLHLLIWFCNIRAANLETLLSASMPEDDELRDVVRKAQRGDPDKAPIHEGTSQWRFDDTMGRQYLLLRKTSQYDQAGLRPFVNAISRVFRCMNDVQWWHSGFPLLRYCSGYMIKYAESWNPHWVDAPDTSLQAGLNVARYWKPAACEQVMVLARESMVLTNVVGEIYTPPIFFSAGDAARENYMLRNEEEEHLTFLEWLRIYKVKNEQVRLRNTSKGPWAIGVRYKKWLSDDFFWQHLQMFKPFRSVLDLCPEPMHRVSPELKCLAASLILMPGTWSSKQWVIEYLRSEGHKEEHVATEAAKVLQMVRRIERQWQGLEATRPPQAQPQVHGIDLDAEQRRFFDMVLALAERIVEDPEYQPRKGYFLTGQPGAGKSAVVNVAIRSMLDLGLQILHVSPTGKQVANVATRDGLVATTAASAFGLMSTEWTYTEHVYNYQVWIVGEVGMLGKETVDFILQHWKRAEFGVLLIFEGDFAQLPPIEGEDARSLPHWTQSVRSFCLTGNHRGEDDELCNFLRDIREQRPSQVEVNEFTKDIVISAKLTREALEEAWTWKPDAAILTATKNSAAFVDAVGFDLRDGPYLGCVMVWTDDVDQELLSLKRGMRVDVKRNVEAIIPYFSYV